MKKANDMRGPALLFTNLKGYPKGFRVLGSPVSAYNRPGMTYSRIATSMGLDPVTDALTIIDELSTITDLPPVEPVIVRDSPCKENKLLGNDVDLSARHLKPFGRRTCEKKSTANGANTVLKNSTHIEKAAELRLSRRVSTAPKRR